MMTSCEKDWSLLEERLKNDPLVQEWRALADAYLGGQKTTEAYHAEFAELSRQLPSVPCQHCASLGSAAPLAHNRRRCGALWRVRRREGVLMTERLRLSGGRNLPPRIHHEIAVRQLRALYHAMPPALQAQTLARVLEILERERQRGQNQPSALARLAPEVYGLRRER